MTDAPHQDLTQLASRYHEELDAISDRLDRFAHECELRLLRRLRQRQDVLRVQIRLLRKSRQHGLEDLLSGIPLSLESLANAVESIVRRE